MKIVTFNIRYDNPEDGVQNIKYRLPYIFDKIKKESPDIIGFQEVQPHISEILKEELTQYTILGLGREADLSGEQTAIAFRKKAFDLFRMECFWLSETPNLPGSRYEDQSICPRTCTCISFFSLEDNRLFRLYNTHLDHKGSSSRILAISQILEKIKEDNKILSMPYILMGDFNATPESTELNTLYQSKLLIDQTAKLSGTFHDFGKLIPPEKDDYIFTSMDFTCSKAGLWTDCNNGVYLSDHYPVFAEINESSHGSKFL